PEKIFHPPETSTSQISFFEIFHHQLFLSIFQLSFHQATFNKGLEPALLKTKIITSFQFITFAALKTLLNDKYKMKQHFYPFSRGVDNFSRPRIRIYIFLTSKFLSSII